MNFNSHLDAVVLVAVDLVNILTPGWARGRTYEPPAGSTLRTRICNALRDGQPATGPLTAPQAAEFQDVAGQLRAVFSATAEGDLDAAAGRVNDMLARTGARPRLDRHDGEPWHLHYHGAGDTLVTGWAAGCATGLAVVLGSDLRGRLGVCTAPRCDRVYVDASRNGTRRFCSVSCQNRVKATAFRARQG